MLLFKEPAGEVKKTHIKYKRLQETDHEPGWQSTCLLLKSETESLWQCFVATTGGGKNVLLGFATADCSG